MRGLLDRIIKWWRPLVYQGIPVHGKSVSVVDSRGVVVHRWDNVDRFIKGHTSQPDSGTSMEHWEWVEVLLMNGKRDSYSVDGWPGEMLVLVR